MTETTVTSIERYVKNCIYPTVKFLSDVDDDYNEPDFVVESTKKQTVKICENILAYLGRDKSNLTEKIKFWKAYRKTVKDKINQLRYYDVRRMKTQFRSGIPYLHSVVIYSSLHYMNQCILKV